MRGTLSKGGEQVVRESFHGGCSDKPAGRVSFTKGNDLCLVVQQQRNKRLAACFEFVTSESGAIETGGQFLPNGRRSLIFLWGGIIGRSRQLFFVSGAVARHFAPPCVLCGWARRRRFVRSSALGASQKEEC